MKQETKKVIQKTDRAYILGRITREEYNKRITEIREGIAKGNM